MTIHSSSPKSALIVGAERQKRAAQPRDARAVDLLAWYDRHRRALPWRAAPGERPDPYRVWLSEVMLQQTTTKAVAPYFARFTARWSNVRSLAAAPLEDVLKLWAGLGYYARARHLHACAKAVVARHGGGFPRSEAALAALPGLGPYTAAAIAAIAFDAPVAAVDGNVERVVARFYAVEDELPAAKQKIRRLAEGLVPVERAGDFVKAPKKEGRLRRGAAFVVLRSDGFVLLRSRPPRGLLGGMTEVPTTQWTHDFDGGPELAPHLRPAPPSWRRIAGVVTHAFTHFPLELVVYVAEVSPDTAAPPGARWVARADVGDEALPNLMRKVLGHALG